MTPTLVSRRPDDVSPEESKRLLALFDACLQAEKEATNADDLAQGFLLALQASNFDGETQALLQDCFDRTRDGELDGHDHADVVGLLKNAAKNNPTAEELIALRRLEFIFTLAVMTNEEQRASLEFYKKRLGEQTEEFLHNACLALDVKSKVASEAKRLVDEVKRLYGDNENIDRESLLGIAAEINSAGDIFEQKLSVLSAQFYNKVRAIIGWEYTSRPRTERARRESAVIRFGAARKDSTPTQPSANFTKGLEFDPPFVGFKKNVLWEILGDARPQTAAELARVLRDKGIVLRHAP